jgi:hypothetical protein
MNNSRDVQIDDTMCDNDVRLYAVFFIGWSW